MSVLVPNTALYTASKKRNRTGVKVNGVAMAGVVDVTLVQGERRHIRPDGHTVFTSDGEEYVVIKVMRRFVTLEGDTPA